MNIPVDCGNNAGLGVEENSEWSTRSDHFISKKNNVIGGIFFSPVLLACLQKLTKIPSTLKYY